MIFCAKEILNGYRIYKTVSCKGPVLPLLRLDENIRDHGVRCAVLMQRAAHYWFLKERHRLHASNAPQQLLEAVTSRTYAVNSVSGVYASSAGYST